MLESDFDAAHANRYFRGAMVEEYVRRGEILLTGRTDDQVRDDIRATIDALASDQTFEVAFQLDHQHSLLNEAGRYAKSGNFNFALMFYATWLEHWVNGMHAWRAEIAGDSMAEVEDFIRNNNFMPKIKKEWSKRFGESLPENLVSSALKVAWARNEFVHYKWLPRLEDEDKAHDAATAEAVREAASLVEPLLKIEDRLAFNGEYSRLTRILDDLYLK